MRKALIIALGLASLGTFIVVPFALAEKYDAPKRCHDMGEECASGQDGRTLFCLQFEISCNAYNADHGYQDPSDPDRPRGKTTTSGGVTNPRPGGGGSRRIGGTLKTADGRTVIPMITPPPENKTWFWNGKTTTVVLYSRSNSAVYITVMQGDPDVSLRKTVNGRSYNVADPAYAAAIAAEQAKAGGSKGGAKGGPKVGYHPPAGLVSGGVATFNAPAQPVPVAGSVAVGAGAGTIGGTVTNSGTISTANNGSAVTNSGVNSGRNGLAGGGNGLLSRPGMPKLKAQ